jgi:phage terminase large subunit
VVRVVTLAYAPREEFKPYHDRKQRWACVVAHRRAGKTVACVNDLIRSAVASNKSSPRLAYISPYYAQSKDVAWGYLKEFASPIPGMKYNESELAAKFPNGAQIKLYGADNYDRMRGIYLDGAVLDEVADFHPRAWPEVIRPALADREGWATFIGTPKGRNEFYALWMAAKDNPDWFTLMLKASETKLVLEKELVDLRMMLTQEQYAQEMECSFDAAVMGAYYGKEIAKAEENGQICPVPFDPAGSDPVAAMDIGIGDATAIWVAQYVGREIHVLDYYEASGVGADHYVAVIRDRWPALKSLILPHDGDAREFQTGKSRREAFEAKGFEVRVLPQHAVDDGISAVRLMLPRCYFDAKRCEQGIESLRMYRSEYDEKLKTLKPRPLHDWASHGADAFRYLAMGIDESMGKARPKPANYGFRGRGGWMS